MLPVYIVPASTGWNLIRSADQNGTWDVRALETLDEAIPLLRGDEAFILGLPISAVLAQRLRVPTVESADFPEMVRIQIEKTLPYSTDEVTSDFEIIEQSETDSVVSAIVIHNEKLSEIAGPLLSRGYIPSQVTVYAAQRGATHAAEGTALLIYSEGPALISAITENGKLSLARTLEGAEPDQLQLDLPQLTLSAELQGISTAFPSVLLDESCLPLRPTVEHLFSSRPEIVTVETPPAATALNLLPDSWKHRRAQLVRLREWRKRLLWAAAAYGGLLFLLFAYLMITNFRVSRLSKAIERDQPKVEFVRNAAASWTGLRPAIDPQYYPLEILLHLFENLPSDEVHITVYQQSARQISVNGEANSPALAYQFAEKVKKDPKLRAFQFQMGTPNILANNHAQFRLEGKAQ